MLPVKDSRHVAQNCEMKKFHLCKDLDQKSTPNFSGKGVVQGI